MLTIPIPLVSSFSNITRVLVLDNFPDFQRGEQRILPALPTKNEETIGNLMALLENHYPMRQPYTSLIVLCVVCAGKVASERVRGKERDDQ